LFLASEHFVFVGFLVGTVGAVKNSAPPNDNIYIVVENYKVLTLSLFDVA